MKGEIQILTIKIALREAIMQITRHANRRIQQRGFRKRQLELILEYGSVKRKKGNAYEIGLTVKEIEQLIQNSKRIIQTASKCKNKAVLVDSDMGTIITVYNISDH